MPMEFRMLQHESAKCTKKYETYKIAKVQSARNANSSGHPVGIDHTSRDFTVLTYPP